MNDHLEGFYQNYQRNVIHFIFLIALKTFRQSIVLLLQANIALSFFNLDRSKSNNIIVFKARFETFWTINKGTPKKNILRGEKVGTCQFKTCTVILA